MAKGDKTNNSAGYQVGYGKPPARTRFKKGHSGNPKGRPKGTQNFATVLERTLSEQVVINENGQRRVITKLEAVTKQLVNKALSGDLGASRQLFMLVQIVQEQSQDAATPMVHLDDADQKVVMGMLKRFERSLNEDKTDEDDNGEGNSG